jgi:hypothetical protein
MEKQIILSALLEGSLHLEGQFIYGSNYTFMVHCQHQKIAFKAVYKPLQGEPPLGDFPHQTLAHREVAAYLLSEALGWALVPPTVFRLKDAPMGPGSIQFFIEHDPEYHYFNFKQRHLALMPKVMLFDLLINNADRKAGHLIVDPQGKLWLIDHGLSFNIEDKLRTVIWDQAGQSLPQALVSDIKKILVEPGPTSEVYQALQPHLNKDEISALKDRAVSLIEKGNFPLPPEDRRAYPWPLV